MFQPDLVVVDGSAFFYRSFHALPELTSPQGELTGAVFGMVNMLKKLRAEYKSEYFAVLFDTSAPTFRHHLALDYKAQRPPMPPSLASQLPLIDQALALEGWPSFRVEGLEADDLLASLALAARSQGRYTLIASGDKDLAQLVDSHIWLHNGQQLIDSEGVRQRFGVAPEQIVDYLALVGDSSDNIHGIPKVGPKTAAAWLNQYGDLEHLLAAAPSLGTAAAKQLLAHQDRLDLARQMITLSQRWLDLPPWSALQVSPPDSAGLHQLYARLGFRQWLKQLPTQPEQSTSALSRSTLPTAQISELAQCQLLAVCGTAEPFAVRIDDGVCVATSAQLAPFKLDQVPLYCWDGKAIEHSTSLNAGDLFGQHQALAWAGRGEEVALLAYLAEAHLSLKPQDVLQRIGVDAGDQLEATLAFHLPQLATHYRNKLSPAGLALYEQLEKPLAQVLCRMELCGIELDVAHLARLSQEFGQRMAQLEEQLFVLAEGPFNPASPKQLAQVLFERLGLPVIKKTPSGVPSTDEEVLNALAALNPLPKALLEHRHLAKLKNTYTDKLPGQVNPSTGRIHTTFAQHVAITGRLSSLDPNLQNIPIRSPEGQAIRQAFVARAGYSLISLDYSQIELRLLAHFSGDAVLCEAFAAGIDIHRLTAAQVLAKPEAEVSMQERRWAKAINFGLVYGMGAFGLARELGIGQKAAAGFIERYFNRFPQVLGYLEASRAEARQLGYSTTLMGRQLVVGDINSAKAQRRQGAERLAVNAPIQGSAADIIKQAMLAADGWLSSHHPEAKLLLQVHDELVIEAPSAQAEAVMLGVRHCMESAASLKVALVAEGGIGHNWGQTK